MRVNDGEQFLTHNNLMKMNNFWFFKFWVQMCCWSKLPGGQVTGCYIKVHHRLDWLFVLRYEISKNCLMNFRVEKKLSRCFFQLKVEGLFHHSLSSCLLFSRKPVVLLVCFPVTFKAYHNLNSIEALLILIYIFYCSRNCWVTSDPTGININLREWCLFPDKHYL